MSALTVWENAQPIIREKIGATTYDTWFANITPKEKSPSILVIETPDEFFKNWIIEHYQSVISDSLEQNGETVIAVEYAINENSVAKEERVPARLSLGADPLMHRSLQSLNPRFTFDNFVIGSSNRFACAACMAVAESPAKAYNPLFIYGQVGLGKTHLMQSITHKIKTMHPHLKLCYISSERFTNEMIDAIRNRSTNQFRQKYRNIDVLLIDDIHFIAGKESTQEEFFHTFNTLHNNRKQIIISSDRPPRDISNLEERLSSRFAWGLITDIQPPDYETRVAILRKKIEREPVNVPDNVISFIAEQIKTNIRELEGALIRVMAYSLLEEKSVTLEMAKVILKDMVLETGKAVEIVTIQKHVAAHFKISIADMKSKRRSRNLVLPRQIAMYISRQLTNLSLPEIGAAFGGKDHTTVLHSCKKIDHEKEKDKDLLSLIERMSTDLQ